MNIDVKKILPTAIFPKKAHESDAAFDLYSSGLAVIAPGETETIGTGIALSMPDGICSFVLSRSGLAAKNAVFVLNSPGLIDTGYRGEVKVILHNAGRESYPVTPGDRIAQLFFSTVLDVALRENSLFGEETDRGEDGLGSTGTCGHKNIVFDAEQDSFVCPRCYTWFSEEQINAERE
jgi:dUTP pyrophosphatase